MKIRKPTISLAQRFWSHTTRAENGCLEWIGARFRSGYGEIVIGYRHRRAHRVAWELTHGPIPNGLCVLHSCDNPPCVDPNHLSLGTHQKNMDDMLKRGRHNPERGEKRYNAKLNEAKVREMRAQAGAVTQAELARRYGLDPSTVASIINRERWKHVA